MVSWGPDDFERILSEIRPKIGNYGWFWSILRARARQTGEVPVKLYPLLRRFCNPKKPYFIEKTSAGVVFVGDYRDGYSINCVVHNNYDAPLLNFLRSHVKPSSGDFLDVGANMGVVSASMAKFWGAQVRVIAFEPVPDTARRAAATFALNNLCNVTLVPGAIGDVDTEITFFVSQGHSEGASAIKNSFLKQHDCAEIKVPCHTLDTLAQTELLQKIGFIKIDVEGHEPQAVKGAQSVIARDSPGILYEYHPIVAPSVGWKASDVARLINAAKPYDFRLLQGDGSVADFSGDLDLNTINLHEVFNIIGEPRTAIN